MATKNFLDLTGLTTYTDLLKNYIDENSDQVSITPSLPRGTKIADYEIDGVSSELLAPITPLTQSEYNALPSTKYSDGIVYFVTETRSLDSNYTYYTWGQNEEIVVRVYHEGEADEEIIWYFHNYKCNNDVAYGRQAFPSSLAPYFKATSNQSANMYYSSNDEIAGWMVLSDYSDGTINCYSSSYYDLMDSIVNAKVVIGDGEEQDTTYENPYVWVVGGSCKIILNGVDYLLNNNSGKVFYDTTANWAEQTTLVSTRGAIYIYSDYQDDNGTDVPGFKVGDGLAYVVDLPFVGKLYNDHLADTVSHITSAERSAWNDKVRCYLDSTDAENIIFTTN